MKDNDYAGKIIPPSIDGVEINTSSKAEFDTILQAKEFYLQARNKFLNINTWHETSQLISAEFQIIDIKLKEVSRQPIEGDYFRIKIPGPDNATGDGYDWVRVEKIVTTNNDSEEGVFILVRPVSCPTNDNGSVAHFYSSDTTSTFNIQRIRNSVIAQVIDSNTKVNQDVEGSDKLRAIVVGTAAITAFSKIQWKGLVNGLTKK